MHTWHEEENNNGGSVHTNASRKSSINKQPNENQHTTSALLDFIFASPSQAVQETAGGSVSAACEVLGSNVSLMDQIRRKAKYLRETKLIDKVSITSSNFSGSSTNLNEINDTDSSNNEASGKVGDRL